MADIVLFGATGYTGRLTAEVLHRRGADFAIAGRDPEKLKTLADQVGSPEVRVADSSDVTSVRDAVAGSKVLITCVGPFLKYGRAAVEAAIAEGVHYVDSTGEGLFIDEMVDRFDRPARDAGIALAPACGFDESPGDLAISLACEGLAEPEVTVTYAVPSTPSQGTLRSIPAIITSTGPFIEDGARRWLRTGERDRWSPLPDPVGPKRAVSFPLALLRLAPLHQEMTAFGTYMTVDNLQWAGLRFGFPAVKAIFSGPGSRLLDRAIAKLPEGPDERKRKARWTILVEARSRSGWRNVVVKGSDVYGLTAETLSLAAERMASGDNQEAGIIAPVQAMGVQELKSRLEDFGVTIETYGSV